MLQIGKLVGVNVRRLRKDRKYTQEQFAVMAGLDSYYVSRLELGKENPTVFTLQKIAMALNVEVHELLLKPLKLTE